MEIISGVQEYDIKANWKLLVENSVDDYHLVTTHSTWLNYMRNSGVNVTPAKGHMLPTKGFGKDLGNGHLTTDNPNYRGRRWRAGFRSTARRPRPTSTRSARKLVDRLGEARAARVADTNRTSASSPISSSMTARR
jgi:phenylpropionate dioxygenase-like ring-hydroxylating dioxygenase large terminal subunit